MANFPLRSGPRWLDILLVVALSVITPLVALRLRIVLSVLVGVLALVALCVAAQLWFNHGTIVTVVYALAAGILAILATAAIRPDGRVRARTGA